MSVTHTLDTSTSRAHPVPAPMKRLTVPKLMAMKGGEPIVMLTAYTARMAQLLDPHCDLLLVGDSLGMVVYGLDSTLPVTMEMMINHGAAVVQPDGHMRFACSVSFLLAGGKHDGQTALFQHGVEQSFQHARGRILRGSFNAGDM